MKLEKNLFVFDVESDGLYGDGFAVGAVVVSPTKEIIDQFEGKAEEEKVENEWVKENVLPNLKELKTFSSRKEMRKSFY